MAIYNPPPTAVPTVHHTTHEVGGTDSIANVGWTTQPNTFVSDQVISGPSGYARYWLRDTSQPVDQRQFLFQNSSQTLSLATANDAGAPTVNGFQMTRTGNVIIGGTLGQAGVAGNVPRLDAANVFATGAQQFNNVVGIGGAPNTGAGAGDLSVSRSGGTSGAIFFGNGAGARYLFYDGTTFQF